MISLGSNCSITYQLNKYNKRKEAYPFDWCKISVNQLLKVLENNFSNYTDSLEIKKYSENHDSYIITNSYNIQYAHEVITNNIDDFKISLSNRIERFNNLDNITFIRIELDIVNENYINKIKRLIELLKNYVKNFTIKLILRNKIDFSNDLALLERIKIYYYDDYIDWQMSNIDWKYIL